MLQWIGSGRHSKFIVQFNFMISYKESAKAQVNHSLLWWYQVPKAWKVLTMAEKAGWRGLVSLRANLMVIIDWLSFLPSFIYLTHLILLKNLKLQLGIIIRDGREQMFARIQPNHSASHTSHLIGMFYLVGTD